jgi:hypothetical protein
MKTESLKIQFSEKCDVNASKNTRHADEKLTAFLELESLVRNEDRKAGKP